VDSIVASKAAVKKSGRVKPTSIQMKYLRRGLIQAGGKLPLFDEDGQRVGDKTVQACIRAGWAEPWFANPMKPDWLVCKITDTGRKLADA
jgi:hypothetical protein